MAFSIVASVSDGWAVVLTTPVGGAHELRLRLMAHVELVRPGLGFLCLVSLRTRAFKSAHSFVCAVVWGVRVRQRQVPLTGRCPWVFAGRALNSSLLLNAVCPSCSLSHPAWHVGDQESESDQEQEDEVIMWPGRLLMAVAGAPCS